MIITLSRQMGSYGDEIAARVVVALGLTLTDRALVRREALEAGVSIDVLRRLMYEGQRSWAAEILDSLGSTPEGGCGAPSPLLGVFAPIRQPTSIYLEEGAQAIAAVVRRIAERGNTLILGQGGQVLLRNRSATLHVQIMAPLEQRVARIVACAGLMPRVARQQAQASDRLRADYLARYHGAHWLDPFLYHLIINTGQTSVETAVAVIVQAARQIAPAVDA